MTCLGVLERGEQDDDNETGLKEGGGIEMSIYSASIYAMLALLRLNYLPPDIVKRIKINLPLLLPVPISLVLN